MPGERFSRCTDGEAPVFQQRLLLGIVPVGAYEFSDSNVVSGRVLRRSIDLQIEPGQFREKLFLLEKSTAWCLKKNEKKLLLGHDPG